MRLAAVIAALALTACDVKGVFVPPVWSLERMLVQPRQNPFGSNDFFVDGRAMRPPPVGAMSREATLGDSALTHGAIRGRYVTSIPVPLSRAMLERGRDRFDIFCAACHGVLGTGASVIARKMEQVTPPSLPEKVRDWPIGRLYRTIREGYGLMPSYDVQLSVDDRWAVVAYLLALEKADRSRIERLPPAIQVEATRSLEP
jgi:mono/diheme cytochrome c family protein